MKNQKLLSFSALLFSLFFCFQTQAQSVDGKSVSSEKSKQDEVEVTKFANDFLDNFIQHQDLSKIPANFFDKDFKSRFVNNEDCLASAFQNEKIAGQDQYQTNVIVHNFSNLMAMTVSANFDKEKYEKSGEDFSYSKQLPANVIEKFRKTKWLKFMLEEDNDEESAEPKTSVEVKNFLEEMSALSDEMRIHLQNHPFRNSANFLRAKKESFKYYAAEPRKPERCLGLPAETPIFAVHQFMMCLRIAKIDGQLKIVQVYSVACED